LKIILNGKEKDVPDNVSVIELLSFLGINSERVAVEINLEVISRDLFKEHKLKEGDQIEIVSFMAGG